MPRPRHALGRPRTEVIPHDWETTHAPVVAKTFTAKCRIKNPAGAPTIGDDLDYTPVDATAPVYDDWCRVQKITSDTMPTVGDQVLARSRYLVVLNRDATGVAVGATVDVYESNDPDLNGQVLTVAEPVDGSLRFERDLFCVSDEGV